ncbi:MAG: M56 family metallopeptidase [Marinicellaceae bacterium]
MYQYFAFNIIFSMLILFYLSLLKTAPFRVRFWLVMSALASWFVPYDVIFNLLKQQSIIYTSPEISQFNGLIKQSIVKQVNTVTFITPVNLFISLTFVGFLVFIKDILSLKHHLIKYSSKSTLLKKTNSTNVYKVLNNDNIFTVGFFNPKIYIGDKYINSMALPSIIQHELKHIENNDQIWLLFITFVQKIFWWNPIVFILSKKARDYIELSCDEMCKQKSHDNSYQKDLAQILIDQHKSSNPLTSSFFGKSKLNIYRIKQLSKDLNMKKFHKTIVFLTLATPFLLVPLITTSSVSSGKTVTNEKGEKVTLNENQIDLQYSITLKTNTKGDRTDSIKIESNLIMEFDEKVSYGNETDLFKPSKFQPVNPTNFNHSLTVKKIDEKSVLVVGSIVFNNFGERIEHTPSIWIEHGKQGSTSINGNDYDIDFVVKPSF